MFHEDKKPSWLGSLLADKPRLSDRAFLGLVLLCSASFAALLQPRYDVGFINDDASFVLLARLLSGHPGLSAGSSLGATFSHFMPGYPLFLAPFAALFEPRWYLLRCVMAAVSLLGVYGFWRLLDGWLSAEGRRWTVFLYALHPLFILCSGMVMADPFLAAIFVFALLGLRRVLEGGKGAWPCVLLCSMAAWAVCTKPIGVLLSAVLTAALLSARAWRALRWLALLIWLPLLGAGLASLIRNQSPSDYLHYMAQGLASLAHQSLWERAYYSFHTFVLVYGLACPWPRGPVLDLLGAVLIAGGEGAARPSVRAAPGAVRGHVRRTSRARAGAHHVPLDGLFRALRAADPAVRAPVPGGRAPRPREIPSAGRPAAAGGYRPGFSGPHRAACRRNQFAGAARGDQALLPDAGLDTA